MKHLIFFIGFIYLLLNNKNEHFIKKNKIEKWHFAYITFKKN